jgi:photoactive yellow protein
MEIVKYENYDLNTIVERIPEKIRDDLPFGLIKLDLNGTILEYNMAEAELTGFRPEEVIGRNFFLDVATCTQTPGFYGKFREGVDKGLVNVQFDYMFDTNMMPTTVRVRMVQMHNVVWMTVRRLNDKGQTVDIARAPGYVAQSQPHAHLPPAQTMDPAQLPAFMQNQPSGGAWMPPQQNQLDPAYVNQASLRIRGTPAQPSQLPPATPPAGSWPSEEEARAWAQAQAQRQRANWAASPVNGQPQPVAAPAAPAKKVDASGLEAFEF